MVRLGWLGAVLWSGGVVALPVAAAAEDGGSDPSVVTVPVAADAWYQRSPVCDTPLACVDGPELYPDDTLHAGVLVGQEAARTYLTLDLPELPPDALTTSAILVLPLLPDEGTHLPELASVRVCLVTEPVDDEARGSSETPPTVRCDEAEAEATYIPATEDDPTARFEADLTTLLSTWAALDVPASLAVVPGVDVAVPDTWHLAFPERSRSGPRVEARLTLAPATSPASTPPPSSPPPSPPPVAEPSGGSTGFAAPRFDIDVGAPPDLPAPALTPPEPAQPGERVTLVVETTRGFAYSAVFLLPLAFLAASSWLARAFTQDLARAT